MSDEDLSRRAIAAYLRTERDGIFIVDEPGGSSGVIEHLG
jgi:hypothetical protein